MTTEPVLNPILGLASTDAVDRSRASKIAMTRAGQLSKDELSSSQRLVAVMSEAWTEVPGSRGSIVASLASNMANPATDLLEVNLLAYALATEGEDGITELAPLLSHEDFSIRAYAAEGLGCLDNKGRWATPVLLRALASCHPDWEAATIIRALGRIGGQEASTALETLASGARERWPDDPHILEAIEQALAEVRSQES